MFCHIRHLTTDQKSKIILLLCFAHFREVYFWELPVSWVRISETICLPVFELTEPCPPFLQAKGVQDFFVGSAVCVCVCVCMFLCVCQSQCFEPHDSLHHFKLPGFFNHLASHWSHRHGEVGPTGEGSPYKAWGHTGKWLPYI